MKGKEVVINNTDFWVNIVDFMQQYWGLIEKNTDREDATVYFLNEASGIFATLHFESVNIAEKALMQNGFKRYDDPLENFRDYLTPPRKPYYLVINAKNHKWTS